MTQPEPTDDAHLAELLPLERLGPVLAQTMDDPRWTEATASLISGGKSNLTFAVTSQAGTVIVRRPPSGDLLPSAHDMGREARIQRCLADTPVPVPPIRYEDRDGDLIGVPFYVMDQVSGFVIRDELPTAYQDQPDAPLRIADALVDVMAQLHAVDPDQVGLGDYGRPHGFLERQIRRWTSQWESSKTHEVVEVSELAARLQAAMPEQKYTGIAHGDYRLDNCLMADDDPGRLTAVLDWELSTLGDPLTDLGMFLFYWGRPGEQPPTITPGLTRTEPGFPGPDHLVDRYADLTGFDLGDLEFYLAFAHFKFAVIAQGIAARVKAGSMGGQDFGDLDTEVLRVARDGLHHAEQIATTRG